MQHNSDEKILDKRPRRHYVTVHAYFRPEIRTKLEQLARRHHRSMSSELAALVEDSYRREFL